MQRNRNLKKVKKSISRNICLVSVIFVATFSIMLITNFFQVRKPHAVQWEVVEKLKQVYEEDGDNRQLQEQIRELDLIARKAFFISQGRLKRGVVILLVMTALFFASLHVYFSGSKNIPNKEIAPVDDWIIKSKTRKYFVWSLSLLALGGVLFALRSSPYLSFGDERLSYGEAVIAVKDTESDWTSENRVLQEGNALLKSDSASQVITFLEDTNKEETSKKVSNDNSSHNGFRGDYALGISYAKNVPVSWDLSLGKNILWKVKSPRKGHNSPVINQNKIFFSGADHEARELYCFDLNTGTELWRLSVANVPGSPAQMPEISEETGYAASGVATNGKQVCAIFPNGDAVCTDIHGKQLWAKNLGLPDNLYGYASSLLIYNNLLIIQYDNHNVKKVVALDVNSGNQQWSQDRLERNPSWSSPIVALVNNQPQLILIGNPGVCSYNPNNGALNWRVECMSGEPAASPAYANGIVFAATEYAALTAINATDGSVLWTENEFLPEVASPVATKDFVFIATVYGVVATFDAANGKMIKYMELSSMFYSSPIIVEDKIYLLGSDGDIYIFSAKSNFELITSFKTGEETFATPAFTNQKIVIRTQDYLYCVGS